jgi:hypothetical protein
MLTLPRLLRLGCRCQGGPARGWRHTRVGSQHPEAALGLLLLSHRGHNLVQGLRGGVSVSVCVGGWVYA